jgi:hypothetical protein
MPERVPTRAATGACAVALDGSGSLMVVIIAGLSSPGVATSVETLSPDKTVRTNQPAMKATRATATPNPMTKGREIPEGCSCPRLFSVIPIPNSELPPTHIP